MDGYLRKTKATMDMLENDIKRPIQLLVLILFASACGNINKNEAVDKTNLFVKTNFENYSDVYKMIIDSVDRYVEARLSSFKPEYVYGWDVDSMICLNKSGDRLVALTLERKGAGKGYYLDDVMRLLGKKIDGQWYFFHGGGTLSIPRESYGYSELNPPSQFQLSQIARENCLASALIKDENGNYVVSDAWVEKHFYNNGYGNFSSRAAYDSVHWKIILDKWKHKIDTNEYKPLHKSKIPTPKL